MNKTASFPTRRLAVTCAAALFLAGCATQISEVNMTKEQTQTAAQAGLGYLLFKPGGKDLIMLGLAYIVYDPLAPNWEIEETQETDDIYRMELRMKAHFSGGEGEAMAILKRRARFLQQERGFAGYQILSYNEGIESKTLAARRYGEGVIRMLRFD